MIRRTGQCFLIYSFLGWVLEGIFHLAKEGTFHKPNFLHGPVKPMYGFAGVLLAVLYDRKIGKTDKCEYTITGFVEKSYLNS